MANYNTFIVIDCNARKPILTTSSARKAYKHLEVGKRIEVWNNNKIVEKIRFSDTRLEKNPLAPYIKLEREYIRKKQRKAEMRNRRRRERLNGKANQPC